MDDAEERVQQIYEQLHRLAAGQMRGERPDHTLQATALVNEAWLRVAEQGDGKAERSQFLAVAALMIRRILVDHARGHLAERRGGGRNRVTLVDEVALMPATNLDVLDLDEALGCLAEKDPRKVKLVELRFFGGLTMKEAAAELGISERVAADDWAMARAWLHRELSKDARR